MSKIAVFYHTCDLPGWKEMFEEQTARMKASGLLDNTDYLWVGLNGREVPQWAEYNTTYRFNPRPDWEETDTLIKIKDFCAVNPDYKVLYTHMKGIKSAITPAWPSHTINGTEYTRDWRRMLEHYVIDLWQDCVNMLDGYDACGPNWTYAPRPHYSGGMWWANAALINRLDHNLLATPSRWDREFWIGSGEGLYANVHSSGRDHYNQPYPEELYTPIPDHLKIGKNNEE